MKKIRPFILAFVGVMAIHAQEKVKLPAKEELRQMIAENNVPALGIGKIESGKITDAFVIGELKAGVVAGNDAIFDTASITKSITTWLTLRLVSEGLFYLDEPLHTYWVDPDVKEDPFHRLLTARHVLGHQSGFKNWRFMNADGKLAFDFQPGTQVQYSGEGFEYLKEALTRKFKKSFAELTVQWVFGPYAMQQSHVVWDDSIDASKIAIAHDLNKAPYLFDIEERKRASAADNFMTTVDDLAGFGIAVLNQVGVSEGVYRQMIASKSQVREGVAFGLGWIVFENLPHGEYALLNAGSDKGVNAIVLLLPKSKRGLIALTNGDNGRKVVMQLLGKSLDVGPEILSRF
ncbi:MAG: serine hydrolase domain-containing protein [Bacteroidota bacterium]